MAIHPGAHTDSRPASPLERLVRQQGVHKFGLFFVAGEDDLLPNGDEELSGYVIDDLGQIHSFWTGWDAERHEVTFTEWELVDEEPEWRGVGEYERARTRAGLPPTRRPLPSFEELLSETGWLTVPEIVAYLESQDYWLRHPTVLSRRAKERHVLQHLQDLRGPHGMPLFLRAQRRKTGDLEYIHPLSADAEDILREGHYRLEESLKLRPEGYRVARDDHPVMMVDSEGRLVICAEQDAEPASSRRAQQLLSLLQEPDAEIQEEDATRGVLSSHLRQLIENGTLKYMEGVKLQEQQSMRVLLRRGDGLRLLGQLLAGLEFMAGHVGEDEDVLAPMYEAGLFAK